MGRIRSVKPELCTSETMASLSAAVERTFVRLWTHCDDEGRCQDHPRLLKAALFPLHDDMTPERVDEHLSTLAYVGLICRYELAGKRFLAVTNWAEHQHPQKSRASTLPAPDEGTPVPLQAEAGTPTGDVPEGYGPVVGVGVVVGEVDGGEGKRDAVAIEPTLAVVPAQSAPSARRSGYSDEFETWWTAYPRKVEKQPAYAAYRIARKTTAADQLLTAAREHAQAWAEDAKEPRLILYPERWLKRKLYDEPPERITTTRPQAKQDAIAQRMADWAAAQEAQA